MAQRPPLTVVDLFSGAGGMSYGFHARPLVFNILAAVDAEQSKPCTGMGVLDCNSTYKANIGVTPLAADLSEISGLDLLRSVSATTGVRQGLLDVLICCAPCTDLSRAKPSNHVVDGEKNSLISKTAQFVRAFMPRFLVMENARELIMGRQRHHFDFLLRELRDLGYGVSYGIHFLNDFGLPQIRERALLVAARDRHNVYDLTTLWEGLTVSDDATTVRRAIGHLADPVVLAGENNDRDPLHRAPGFGTEEVRRRIQAIPHDGGSWFDLADHPDSASLLTDSMKDRLESGDLGSYPDVYGRLAWDKPAKTIKRECAHVGNGRYAHPEQDRLITVREASLLQGFPANYTFASRSLANSYRHVGDAVPPIISYQISAVIEWMVTGRRPEPEEFVLAGTSLRAADIGIAHTDIAIGA